MRKIIFSLLILLQMSASSQVPNYVPASGLVGFWPFTGNANDVSANANNGTVNGASLTTDRFSNANSAYSFNGLSNYISVNSNTTLSGFNNLSISAWINLNAFGGVQGVVTKWYQILNCNNNANSDTYEGSISSNQVQFATNNNNLTGFTAPPTLASSSLNSWVHLVYISDASQGQFIYINSILSGSFATTGAICSSSNPLYFGADYHGTLNSFHRFFNGKIDDIGIWNRSLTFCEIQQLYTASTATLSTAGSNTIICSGNQAALQASGASTYTWLPGGGTSSLIVVSPSVTSTYTVSGTNGFGCLASNTLTVLVNPTPTLLITPSPATFCAGQQVTLTANGATSYSWTGIGTGSSIVVTAISPSSTFTLVGVTGSCAVTSYLFYGVPPLPVVTASSSTNSVCQGSAVTLGANGAFTYTWQPGNIIGSSVIMNPNSNTTYTVTGASTAGCFNSDTVSVAVSIPVTLTVNANPVSICPGNSATLSVTGATSYTWFPGNLNGSSITVSPIISTQYTVNSFQGACQLSSVLNLSVGLDVSLTPIGNLCTSTNMILTAIPSNTAFTYVWIGPGIQGPSTGSSINVNAAGTYSVLVTNTINNCSGSASISVTGGLNSIALTIVPSSTETCFPGPPVNMLVSASANLNWLPSNEVNPNNGPLVSVSPSVTSTYTVNASLGTCTGSTVVTISVNPTPTLTALSSGSAVCLGKTMSLSAQGALNYSWDPVNLSGASVTLVPASSAIFSVTGSNGICSSTATLAITVLPNPFISTTVSPSFICLGKTSSLTASGAPLIAWLIGDPPPLSSGAIVSPSATTIYSVIGTNSTTCSSIATVQVNVIQSPVITASATSTLICAGQSVTLTANGGSTYTWVPGAQSGSILVVNPSNSTLYTVTGVDPSCSRAVVTISVNPCVNNSLGLTNAAQIPYQDGSEVYKVQFTVTVNNSSDSELSQISLENDLEKTFPYPISYTVASTPVLISKNSKLSLNNLYNGSSEKGLTLPSNSLLDGKTRDTLVFTVFVQPKNFIGELKNYVLGFGTDLNNNVASDSSNNGFLVDPDNDGNPGNNNTMTPIEINYVDLFIPNGFSPNSDGTNDNFVIKGLHGITVDLNVYNRWGNKVYSKLNYDNSWDGSLNSGGLNWGNGKVPEGTYYYILNLNTEKKETRTGFIVINYNSN